MKHGEICDRLVCGSFFLVRFVVHHRDLELLTSCRCLHQRIGPINERLTIAIPIHHECSDSHGFGAADLALNLRGIMRRIADRNMFGMAEPSFVHGECLWGVSSRNMLQSLRSARPSCRTTMK